MCALQQPVRLVRTSAADALHASRPTHGFQFGDRRLRDGAKVRPHGLDQCLRLCSVPFASIRRHPEHLRRSNGFIEIGKACVRSTRFDGLPGGVVIGGLHHQRSPRPGDGAFFHRNMAQRRAQDVGVLQRERSDDAQVGGRAAGRIQPTAQTGLKDEHLHPRCLSHAHGGQKGALKEGQDPVHRLIHRHDPGQGSIQRGWRHRDAVDANSLFEAHQVR